MVNITECDRYCLCVDCDYEKCIHAGDKVADCPRYPQTCNIRKMIESCDECTWIDKYIEYSRKEMKRMLNNAKGLKNE